MKNKKQFQKITFEQFLERYRPKVNSISREYNLMYDYGNKEEMDFVKSFKNNYIWTEIETDYEETYIIPGFHIVNRLCYYITDKAWEHENIEINTSSMISIGKAKDACINFLESIDIFLEEEQQIALDIYFSQLI